MLELHICLDACNLCEWGKAVHLSYLEQVIIVKANTDFDECCYSYAVSLKRRI